MGLLLYALIISSKSIAVYLLALEVYEGYCTPRGEEPGAPRLTLSILYEQ